MLDEITPFEMSALLSNLDYGARGDWERTRTLAFITAQANSTERLVATDLLPLPWDASAGSRDSASLTPEEEATAREILTQRTLELEKQLNSHG